MCVLAVRAVAAQNAPPATAVLAGVVRDSAAAPIAGAEIVVRDLRRTWRTDARGAFTPPQLELIELYPNGTEVTGPVSDRMSGSCTAQSLFQHPTHCVIWERR